METDRLSYLLRHEATAGRITGTDFIPLTDQRADVEA